MDKNKIYIFWSSRKYPEFQRHAKCLNNRVKDGDISTAHACESLAKKPIDAWRTLLLPNATHLLHYNNSIVKHG